MDEEEIGECKRYMMVEVGSESKPKKAISVTAIKKNGIYTNIDRLVGRNRTVRYPDDMPDPATVFPIIKSLDDYGKFSISVDPDNSKNYFELKRGSLILHHLYGRCELVFNGSHSCNNCSRFFYFNEISFSYIYNNKTRDSYNLCLNCVSYALGKKWKNEVDSELMESTGLPEFLLSIVYSYLPILSPIDINSIFIIKWQADKEARKKEEALQDKKAAELRNSEQFNKKATALRNSEQFKLTIFNLILITTGIVIAVMGNIVIGRSKKKRRAKIAKTKKNARSARSVSKKKITNSWVLFLKRIIKSAIEIARKRIPFLLSYSVT